MIPMSDPMTMMMQMLRGGSSPAIIMQQLSRANPQVAQAMQMLQGRSPQQLRQMAENMAKERGVSLNDIARNLGLTIPSEK